MFGISSFSEAPFSGIVDTRDAGWQEIRNNVNTWVTEPTDSNVWQDSSTSSNVWV